jgi:hypothetical protein
MLTEEQLGEFERTLMPPGAGGRTSLRAEIVIPCGFCRVAGSDARPTQAFTISGSPLAFLERYQLAPDQFMAASAAVEAFKADQQLDDTRRSALVAQLAYVLTGEESDNFRAALARRPVVQTSGVMVAALPASR